MLRVRLSLELCEVRGEGPSRDQVGLGAFFVSFFLHFSFIFSLAQVATNASPPSPAALPVARPVAARGAKERGGGSTGLHRCNAGI